MLLLIDKPKGVTSHDVVDRIRDVTGKQKVGHGGTLDPNATGLLIVGVTREGTKKLGKFQRDTKKKYRAEICLGKRTNTLDADGEIQEEADIDSVSPARIESVQKSFLGRQEQIPPKYSAVRVDGKRAHKQARRGDNPDVPPRIVEIEDITIEDYAFPHLTITTTVSSGTYIRSLARDIGDKLGCGAYLENLRRLVVGSFSVKDANALKDITQDNWQNIGTRAI